MNAPRKRPALAVPPEVKTANALAPLELPKEPASKAPDPAVAFSGANFRDADRQFHAAVSAITSGLSPISVLEAWQDWALHLSISPGKQQEILSRAMEKLSRLQDYLTGCAFQDPAVRPCVSPLPQDKRFVHPSWQQFPFNLYHQSFLLAQQWWHDATVGVPGVTAQHERMVEFLSRQFLDVFSPSNLAGTNPEVIDAAIRENGANFFRGFNNVLEDIGRQQSKGAPSGTDLYKVGVNVAITPGEVIFRNELIELIQYHPSTDKVRPEPVLIVPAWIMKYYILDLSPENSLIRYLVSQGFTVFCISWRNPGREHRNVSFDDYRKLGVLAALGVVRDVIKCEKVHAAGYCIGGTLLAITAAALARENDNRLASITLFAAQLDFNEPGELGLFINDSQLAFLEDIMWKEGYLDQHRMAGAFQMLRSQDLVWSRIIREYLLGERPPMSDLMAWNADATRMPYRMHSEYLRSLFLNNDLAQGRFIVDGAPVHVEDIRAPVFAVGTLTDHVAPWRSAFKVTRMFETDVAFVLTSGGHNAGIVSEPGNPRRSYRLLQLTEGGSHPSPDAWVADASEIAGSWWPEWTNWLSGHSGAQIAPPPIGSREFAPIGKAPGTYVLQR